MIGSYGGQSMEARQAGESWKQQNMEGGISSAGTLAAGILSGAVGSRGVLEFLKGHGVSNTAAHAIQAMGSGAAWGGTDTAVTEAGKKLSRGDSYSFDGGAVASSAAVGAMFGILRYIGSVAVTSGQNQNRGQGRARRKARLCKPEFHHPQSIRQRAGHCEPGGQHH